MKKSLIFKNGIALLLISSAAFLASCVKNRNTGAVDFTQLTPIMQIVEGGLSQFSSQSILAPDPTAANFTVSFRVNYAATQPAAADITVTLAYDAAAMAAYNAANPNPSNPYTKMPDSIASFTQTSVVIKAGMSYSDPVVFTVHPNKIDPSKNYMYPISITAAGGVAISANFGTIYYHLIGNPLAGNYQDYGMRYNYTGGVGWPGPAAGLGLATAPGSPSSNPPAGFTATTTYNFINQFSPVDGQTVAGTMGNVPDPSGGSAYYFVTGNASFSAITYDFAATFNGGYSNIDRFIRGYLAPSPTQKPAFRLITHYNNTTGGAGNDRIIDETFIHL